MTHTLVSVDPGSHYAGVAFYVAGHLADVGLVRPHPLGKASTYDVALHVSMWVRRCMHNLGQPEGRVSQLICEGQQIYPGPRRNDPNDMVPLAQVVGGVQARVDAFEREIVMPRIWTKSVPKEVRQRRYLASLDEREMSLIDAVVSKVPKDYRHDVIDAAMIGAYKLGKLGLNPDERLKQ